MWLRKTFLPFSKMILGGKKKETLAKSCSEGSRSPSPLCFTNALNFARETPLAKGRERNMQIFSVPAENPPSISE